MKTMKRIVCLVLVFEGAVAALILSVPAVQAVVKLIENATGNGPVKISDAINSRAIFIASFSTGVDWLFTGEYVALILAAFALLLAVSGILIIRRDPDFQTVMA